MDNPNILPLAHNRKRNRSSSPPPWERANKNHRQSPVLGDSHTGFQQNGGNNSGAQKHQESFAREQTRRNQAQEAEQMRVWVSKEDEFVLKQSKKKAHIRIKERRAKSIDWLAVTLDVIDSTKDLLEDDGADTDVEVVNPASVFEGLDLPQLQELAKEIQSYLTLETNLQNRKYWDSLRVICQDHQERLAPTMSRRRAGSSVSADVDQLLAPKSAEELAALKTQVTKKLQSNEPIDVEYWEQLLNSIAVYSAKAALNEVHKSVVESRLEEYRRGQSAEAAVSQQKLEALLSHSSPATSITRIIDLDGDLDPEPLLKLKPEDKALETIDERQFLANLATDRQRVQKMGYVPPRALQSDKSHRLPISRPLVSAPSAPSRLATTVNDDFSQATTALYEREVARGVQENEEIFAGEEDVQSSSKPQWAGKYRPRKPRYFNRVQMGYEWNKYNQTHYDHDNPPPKVVQGYKFNIFYPDLIDRTKAPTYRIERENGRRRGQSFAPAGEEDTCLIRFISGPPYEDLAFRIVDKEWDYSAKRERGFRSSFDKGILQLHFQFKKVYYRK
ncbi:MAG: hypothetical protein L6R38_007068 [Xanthoria sp. 2 TBL-2021]|nr:MAG: hypothetical protein L6R38_007068 [Xanthoria sp. 2 TBL-2021]